ncbi:hypothetical protein [Psychroserpens ponticola]|uniref:Lipoprotein n=1 Tax=Psychroserpens ponticola TaxID=2932268 RepID=A0ABY7RUH0_9FLAO|nr:hypothetical protein [Psychroserpens ponticola]WCO00574.1 hypothetical protein MUN68_010890 [Psychroserpens ponticola]
MKNSLKFIAIILLIQLSGCASGVVKLKGDTTAGYIPNRISTIDPKGSFGTSYFDVTKRVGISSIYIDSIYKVKYLAEEQPDAGLSIIKELTANLSANKGSDLTATADITKNITKSLEQITLKSYSLNILRSGLYRLNEAAYNNFITKDEYKVLFEELINTTKELQLQELQLMDKKSENDDIDDSENEEDVKEKESEIETKEN